MLGHRIKKIRKEKGYTQQKLSILSGVPQSTISEIERGKRKHPSFQNIKKLTDKLGIKIDDLCD